MLRTFLLLIFIKIALVAQAQLVLPGINEEYPVRLGAQVVDAISGKPVPYVSVLNKRTQRGVSADSSGYFSIVISEKDTLLISRVGYKPMLYTKDPNKHINYFVTLSMESSIIELKTVGIRAKRLSRPDPLMMRYGYKEKMRYRKELQARVHTEVVPTIANPISMLYEEFSKKAKAERLVRTLLAEKAYREKLATKYNAEIVSRITGLEDERLEAFMRYCPMSFVFLETATEYDIAAKIVRCFDAFNEEY